ncbi:MAG TPA: DUF177 domain-containing protein [Armatimonadota bacterium]|jgi:uncharacterized protein
MRCRLLGQLKGPRGTAECEVTGPVPPGTGLEWDGPVRGALTLEKTGVVYSARGWLEATAVLPCSRCTTPHAVPLRIAVDETVSLSQLDEPESYQAADETDEAIPILDGDTIDLSELVRQMLVLHVPPRSLCQSDCRGLCPHCGQDLNRETCSCADQQVDPRLEALRKLL